MVDPESATPGNPIEIGSPAQSVAKTASVETIYVKNIEDEYKLRVFPKDSGDVLIDALRERFNKHFAPLNLIDHDKERRLARSVKTFCSEGGDGDLASPDERVRTRGRIWCSCANKFHLQNGWLPAARRLWLELWDELGQRQIEKSRRISRALLGQLLTETENQIGKNGKVGREPEILRWAILTHAECSLDGAEAHGSYSKHWLTALGVMPAEKELIEKIGRKCQGVAKKNRWSGPAGLSEEALRLCCEDPIGAGLLSRFPTREEFPLSATYLATLADAVQSATSNAQKGKSLENLACYLFLLFGGCIPKRNLKDLAGAAEYDVVVFNYSPESSPFASRFGRQFLVECKNWNKKVTVRDVGYFLQRMHLTHCNFGVIFSKLGATGQQKEERNAKSLIRRAFHEDKAMCLVISLDDVSRLYSQILPSVTSLLMDLANNMQFGK